MRASEVPNAQRELSRWALRALDDPTCWGRFLERYMEICECSHGHLFALMPDERGEIYPEPRVMLHVHRGYGADDLERLVHYQNRQPYKDPRRLQRTGLFVDQDVEYREGYQRGDFYNDCARRIGFEWASGQILHSSPRAHIFLSFQRPIGHRPDAAQKRQMATLGRAVTGLGRVLAARETWSEDSTIMVGSVSDVISASPSARHAVDREPALEWGLALRATEPGLGTALEAAVRAAARASVGDAAFASRRLRAGELELLVSPHPGALDTGLPRAEGRIRRRPPPSVEERLRRAFGLSPREAHVALALVREGSMEEVAERLDVTAGTLRTLASRARRKVGARSRAGLARALAPWLDRPGT